MPQATTDKLVTTFTEYHQIWRSHLHHLNGHRLLTLLLEDDVQRQHHLGLLLNRQCYGRTNRYLWL